MRTCRENQLVKCELASGVNRKPPVIRIDGGHPAPKPHLDAVLAIEVFRIDPDAFLGLFPGEEALRQGWTLVGDRSVRGEDCQFPRLDAQLNQLLGGIAGDHAAANDYQLRSVHAFPASGFLPFWQEFEPAIRPENGGREAGY